MSVLTDTNSILPSSIDHLFCCFQKPVFDLQGLERINQDMSHERQLCQTRQGD